MAKIQKSLSFLIIRTNAKGKKFILIHGSSPRSARSTHPLLSTLLRKPYTFQTIKDIGDEDRVRGVERG